VTAKMLETPGRFDDLYELRGEEVTGFRPFFTGDVIETTNGATMMLVQHPCALRRGAVMLPRLPVVKIHPAGARPRSDWNSESPKQMPLPQLIDDGFHFADFTDIHVVTNSDITDSTRLAILSSYGVNLLMQRWVYHNTRVVISTHTFDEQMAGPFTEADLADEWCEAHDGHLTPDGAMQEFDKWLKTAPDGDHRTWRSRLPDRQEHSIIRKAMRCKLRELA
jgi:hypothetical protein